MQITHHHHVARVAEDPAQTLDVATVARVLGGEGVAELVGVALEPDAVLDPPQQALDRHHAHRLTVTPEQQPVAACIDPVAVDVALDLPA